MKKIVVPTDFSDNAYHALRYAGHLARQLNANIILFHNGDVTLDLAGNTAYPAGDIGFGTTPLYVGALAANADMELVYQERLQQQARHFLEETNQEIPVQTLVRWGSLTENLNELFREGMADLVVMGTQGATSFFDRFIGTNTATVLHGVHGPVLAVPVQSPVTLPRRLAFAAELEDSESSFIEQLLAFAAPLGATVTLVHINSKTDLNIVDDEQILSDIRKRFSHEHLQLRQLSSSTVVAGLEKFLSEEGTDLLAVGIRERGYMESLFHSSVSEKLINHARVPLLSLPAYHSEGVGNSGSGQ